ncbi:MAG: dihydroorotate dehydrogenase electron transfer subunit [Candidatus Omnitrophica bacterium]|nr:dihydroorotate dehydrogenase electron transfer subunit [Candidatus Omnitrophota bacterium]
MLQIKARIISNKRCKGNYRHCIVNAKSLAKASNPGQFLNIRVSDGLKPFLRRPFSVHNINGSNLEILYEVAGEGTKLLADKNPGEYLDIIGPLGHGFDCRQEANRQTILIGGGIGIAPLLFLSRKIKSKNKIALIGARTKSQVLCEKEFRSLGCDVKIATDDGSAGFKGRVTALLKKVLQANRPTGQQVTIYACGPRSMLKAVCSIAMQNNIPAQVSLEEHMSCGIGACLGCVIKTRKGLERVCKEGPVFNREDLTWGKNEN